MYLHHELNQPDKEEFIKAIVKESYKPKEKALEGRTYWRTTSKCQHSRFGLGYEKKKVLGTGEVSKYKARLNAHGGKKEHGIIY